MGCYLPRVPILTTGWSASATIRREMRELTGEPVRLAGFGSTAKKEDARHRIPRVKSGEVERLNTVVVDMVLYEQRRVGWTEGSYLIQDLNQNLFFPEIRHARSVKVLSQTVDDFHWLVQSRRIRFRHVENSRSHQQLSKRDLIK